MTSDLPRRESVMTDDGTYRPWASLALAVAGGFGALLAVGLLISELGIYGVILALVGIVTYGVILHRRRVAAGINPRSTISLVVAFCGPVVGLLTVWVLNRSDMSGSAADAVMLVGWVAMPIVGWVMMRTSRFGVPAQPSGRMVEDDGAAASAIIAPEPTPETDSPVQPIVQPARETRAETPEVPVPEQATEAPMAEPVKSRGSSLFRGLVFAIVVVGLIGCIATDPADEECKSLIEARLRAPDSVEYESREESSLFGNNETWAYTLRARNGFGGMNREQWICTVDRDGKRSAFPM
jgi:hypothetical protein